MPMEVEVEKVVEKIVEVQVPQPESAVPPSVPLVDACAQCDTFNIEKPDTVSTASQWEGGEEMVEEGMQTEGPRLVEMSAQCSEVARHEIAVQAELILPPQLPRHQNPAQQTPYFASTTTTSSEPSS